MDTFDNIIRQSCKVFGVDEQSLFSTNLEHYVDARALAFTILFDVGFTDNDIAGRCHVTRQCVNKLRNGFRERMRRWSVRQAYKELKTHSPALSR